MARKKNGNGNHDWGQRFRAACNDDPELNAHGRHFTCSYLLDMEDHRVLVDMHEGRVHRTTLDPGPLDERYQFAIRASADTWRKFSEKVPPPMYHGIWAASFKKDMRLEGDVLVLMQHLRCLTRQMELLKTTGVPV